MKGWSGGHPGAYCHAPGCWVRVNSVELSAEYKGCNCAGVVGGERQPVPVGMGEGWEVEGAGGGELHLPLLPGLLIAAAYMVISC